MVNVLLTGVPTMSLTITLLASGTRGDVQPYLALGIGLRRAGFNVRVATHAKFAELVASAHLTWVYLDANPSDWFARPGGEYALRFAGRHWLRNVRATFAYWREVRPAFARLLTSAWHAAQGSDALIVGLPTWWGAHIAEALQIRYWRALLQPITPTREFPSPLMPWTFSLGATYNRLTHHFIYQTMRLAWFDVINRWRCEILGLKPTPILQSIDNAPTLYGFSEHIVPRPADWTSEQITGYWFLPPARWTPDPQLEKFLDSPTSTVYIGFGSIQVCEPAQTLEVIQGALAQTGLRAILSIEHNFANVRLPPNIFPITYVAHEWLFPRMAAVVHHGGAGTTAAGLRAGVPTIIVPLVADQFFWGARVAKLGVGPRPIPQSALRMDTLSHALMQTLHDQTLRTRAQKLSQSIAHEDGVARAVALIRTAL